MISKYVTRFEVNIAATNILSMTPGFDKEIINYLSTNETSKLKL